MTDTADGRFSLVKTTLLDFPGKVAAAVFLPGCNLRCPFCQNPDLVLPDLIKSTDVLTEDINSFSAFLDKRARLLGGVVFSGGEALLNPLLPNLIDLVRKHNLKVKLDTAGLLPEKLEVLAENGKIDYAAVDLKTLPDKYTELGWKKNGKNNAENLLKKTLSILKENNIDFEVRTTVVPPLVTEEILEKLIPLASMAPRWIWQPYNKGNTINPDWSDINNAPGEDELRKTAESFPADIPVIIR